MKNKNNKFNSSSMSILSLIKIAKPRVYGLSIATKISLAKLNIIYPSGRYVTITYFNIAALIFVILIDNDLI